MLRRLSALASVLALLLFMATLVLWLQSYGSEAAIPVRYHGERWELASRQGRIGFDNAPQCRFELDQQLRASYDVTDRERNLLGSFVSGDLATAVPAAAEHATEARKALQIARERLDALMNSGSSPAVAHSVSDAVVLVLSFPLPACWCYLLLRAASQQRSGLCLKCGYDLRASPDRCPECGAPVPQKAGAA